MPPRVTGRSLSAKIKEFAACAGLSRDQDSPITPWEKKSGLPSRSKLYSGVDLPARCLSAHNLNHKRAIVFDDDLPADPETFAIRHRVFSVGSLDPVPHGTRLAVSLMEG
jgi:hypothetical protein